MTSAPARLASATFLSILSKTFAGMFAVTVENRTPMTLLPYCSVDCSVVLLSVAAIARAGRGSMRVHMAHIPSAV